MARPKRARKEPERLIDAAPAKKAIVKKAPAKWKARYIKRRPCPGRKSNYSCVLSEHY